MKKSILYLCVILFTVGIASCKNKSKKSLEELSTAVSIFDETQYRKSTLDINDLMAAKQFGSVFDSSAYQKDLDTIASYLKNQNPEDVLFSNSGVAYIVKKHGKGPYPVAGDVLHVSTETRRWDQKVVFSSQQIGQALSFVLGVGQVVPAWDEVLPNIAEGSEVQIISPSAMSYGKKAIPKTLPGNSILIYDIKVEKVIASNPKDQNSGETPFRFNKPEEESNKLPATIRRPTGK